MIIKEKEDTQIKEKEEETEVELHKKWGILASSTSMMEWLEDTE